MRRSRGCIIAIPKVYSTYAIGESGSQLALFTTGVVQPLGRKQMSRGGMLTAVEEQEFDFSNDSSVEQVEGIWTIIAAELEETESDNGRGKRHVITFTGDAVPFPVTVRQFVEYESKVGKDNAWVKRSRGALKQLAKAALGEPKYSLSQLVGKQVRATTKDDGNGYATLAKFRPVTNGSLE